MYIEAVDFFYLSMPEVLDIGDGSQDAAAGPCAAGRYTGWGECEASPLVSIASLVCPMSHSACKPVRDSVLGQTLDDVADIDRIGDLVRANSLDLLQAAHTLSGIDIAMWDLLGRRFGSRSIACWATSAPYPKLPYASRPVRRTRRRNLAKARVAARGVSRGQVRLGTVRVARRAEADAEQVAAAREGLGAEGDRADRRRHGLARRRRGRQTALAALQEDRVTWLEEPFVSGASEPIASSPRERDR